MAATIALAGVLVVGSWASGQTQAPRPCCSRCEECISNACQDSPAKTSLKTAFVGPLETATPFRGLSRPEPALLAGLHRVNVLVLPGFDPPMRS